MADEMNGQDEVMGMDSEYRMPDSKMDTDSSSSGELKVIEFMGMDNIANELEKQQLDDIGDKCKKDFDTDMESMDEWFKQYEAALKLAKQVREKKTFPWHNASNVKIPLIGQAAMNFNARAYPEIIQGDQVVKAKVVGKDDPDESKADRAARISEHMSYQLLDEIPNWEADMDKLLIMLPIVGTMFKEVAWDEIDLRPDIPLLMPDELIVNYYAKSLSLQDCRRISKKVTLFKNDIVERERGGLWIDIDYTTGGFDQEGDAEPIEEDEQCFIQQLCYLDLDDDGYEEPYQVTFHEASGKVVRITANYDASTVVYDEDASEVIKIDPFIMYTDYHFIPAFDGCFYSTGFGSYLYPINQAADSIMNQLIDAGTLNNVQGGFLGKGLRTKTGATPLQPGEWRPVDSKGSDLASNIVPLPAKEPSAVLYNLLMTLIDMGKEMSSVTDVLSGVPQGANTPVGTTLAMIEQGMKVIDAVYKRVYRGLKREYQMLYRLNSIYLSNDRYGKVLDNPEASVEADYATDDFDIMPVGDTRISSQVMRVMKAQQAREMAMQTPNADTRKATMRVFEAMDIPNPEEILPELPPAEVLMAQLEEAKAYGQAMTEEMKRLTQVVNSNEEMRKDMESRNKAMETAAKIRETASKTAGNIAGIEKTMAETEKLQQEMGVTEDQTMEAIEQAAANLATSV